MDTERNGSSHVDQFFRNIVAKILENQRHADDENVQQEWCNDYDEANSVNYKTEEQSTNFGHIDIPLVIKTEIFDQNSDVQNVNRGLERIPDHVLEVNWPTASTVEANGTSSTICGKTHEVENIIIKTENEGAHNAHVNSDNYETPACRSSLEHNAAFSINNEVQMVDSLYVNRADKSCSVYVIEELEDQIINKHSPQMIHSSTNDINYLHSIESEDHEKNIVNNKTSSHQIVSKKSQASANNFQCKFCKKTFKLKNRLNRHNCNKKLNIKNCKEKEDHVIDKKQKRGTLKRVDSKKTEETLFRSKSLCTCVSCGKSFQHKFLLGRHKCVCKSLKDNPEKGGKSKGKVKKSSTKPCQAKDFTNSLNHQCVLCNETFRHKKGLNSHIRTVHGTIFTGENTEASPVYEKENCSVLKENTSKCDLCDKIFNCKESMNRHICSAHKNFVPSKGSDSVPVHRETDKSSAKDKIYQCDLCDKSFGHRDSLRRHKRTFHEKKFINRKVCKPSTEDKIYQCDLCDKSFGHRDSLRRHKRTFHENKFINCKICNKKFSCKSELDRHKIYHCKQFKNCDCSICEEKFADLENLQQHLMNHSLEELNKFAQTSFETQSDFDNKEEILNELKSNVEFAINRTKNEDVNMTYACDLCDKTFTHSRSLSRHKRFHEGTYSVCEICGKQFSDVGSLNRHKVTHSDDKPYKCKLCDQRFNLPYKLTDHMFIHEPQICAVVGCYKKFTSGLAFKRHKRMHQGNIICNVCGKAFGNRNCLRAHQVIHSDVEAFECEFCSKRFKLKKHLNEHKLNLHDDTPLICKVEGCGQIFKHRRGFIHHKRFHEGKFIVCEICGKPFPCLSDLNKHKVSHSNDKPCECDLCDQKFAIPYRLKMHKLNCHTPQVCESKGCNKEFPGKKSLLRHKKKFHSEDRSHSSDDSLDEHEKLRFASDVTDEKEEMDYSSDEDELEKIDPTQTDKKLPKQEEIPLGDSLVQHETKEQNEDLPQRKVIGRMEEKAQENLDLGLDGLKSFPSDSFCDSLAEKVVVEQDAQEKRITNRLK